MVNYLSHPSMTYLIRLEGQAVKPRTAFTNSFCLVSLTLFGGKMDKGKLVRGSIIGYTFIVVGGILLYLFVQMIS